MHYRKKLIVICSIVIVCLLLAGVFFWFQYRSSLTLTVQATLYVPSDDAYYIREYNGYRPYRISPNQTASILYDLDLHKAKFKQNTLTTVFDHGPYSIEGSFSSSELQAHWENIPLEGDWPFCISLYNTSSGRRFQAYMDLELFTDKTQAKATLYIFYEHKAHPEILHWEGIIGEEITFLCEL